MGWLDFKGIEFPEGNDFEALRRIEAKLDKILEHLEIEFDWPTLSQQVRDLADDGKKVESVRLLREESGISLASAKEAVDQYLKSQ